MSDSVFVSGLALHAYHGVMQHEGEVGQTFTLDLVLDLDLTEASHSDRLAHTVGYDQVVEVAERGLLRPALPAGRSRRRRRGAGGAAALRAGAQRAGDRP